MDRLRQFFIGVLENIAYFLSAFVIRDKNIWIFGSWEGERYCDNSKYLFEYLLNNPKDGPKKVFWLTHSIKVRDFLKSKKTPVLFSGSAKAWWYNLRASVIFITHSCNDVIGHLTRGAKIINLNHALPIKHMGYDIKNSLYYNPKTWMEKAYFKISMPYWGLKSAFSISPSFKAINIIATSQRIEKRRIKPFGFPRFFHLLYKRESEAEKHDWLAKIGCLPKIKKAVLYMPTFRENSEYNHFSFNFNPKKIIKSLDACNAVLLIVLHPFDNTKVPEEVLNEENGFIKKLSPMDVNELLPYIDLLITDFSSVMFDFLLLDRPLIYTQFDFNEFLRKERDLYFRYEEVTPGHKARDWEDINTYIPEILLHNKDEFSEQRLKVRKELFNADYRNVFKDILSLTRN